MNIKEEGQKKDSPYVNYLTAGAYNKKGQEDDHEEDVFEGSEEVEDVSRMFDPV